MGQSRGLLMIMFQRNLFGFNGFWRMHHPANGWDYIFVKTSEYRRWISWQSKYRFSIFCSKKHGLPWLLLDFMEDLLHST